MVHAALLLLMLEAVTTDLVFTISLKRSTQNPQLSTSCRPITPSYDAVDGSSTRHVSAMEVGADKAPTIRRSYPCKPLRQSVSTSQNQCFRCTALMLPAR